MPSAASSTLTLLSRAPPDVYTEVERAERAELRADKLLTKLDAERALTASLRRQLRATTASMQQAAQQARVLHGGPGITSTAGDSIVGLQRQISSLRDRLDGERKEKSSLHSQIAQLTGQLANEAREKQGMNSTQEQMAREIARRDEELDKTRRLLRECGAAHDEAIAELCSLTLTHGKDKAHGVAQQAALRAALDAERRRAAARAAREDSRAAVAARRESVNASIASSHSTTSRTVPTPSSSSLSVCEVAEPTGSDIPQPAPPSFSVAGIAAAAEKERHGREAAEACAARTVSQCERLSKELGEAREEIASLQSQLGRRELEDGGSRARSALRALERQVDSERERAEGAEGREREMLSGLSRLVGRMGYSLTDPSGSEVLGLLEAALEEKENEAMDPNVGEASDDIRQMEAAAALAEEETWEEEGEGGEASDVPSSPEPLTRQQIKQGVVEGTTASHTLFRSSFRFGAEVCTVEREEQKAGGRGCVKSNHVVVQRKVALVLLRLRVRARVVVGTLWY
ncbi:MAG: hypothetical protein SGPRY_001952 [Prymnesium sp.]